MTDPRNTQLAKVFIEHSLDVQKGDKVVISTSDLYTEDLIRECYKLAVKKGAIVYLDIMGWNYFLDRSSFGGYSKMFLDLATKEQILNPPEIYKNIAEWGDKFIRITSLDNYVHLAGVDEEKLKLKSKSYHDWFRIIIDSKKWVLTYYPTLAMAQQAGMSLSELEDFFFSSTLVDYEAMRINGEKIAKLIDDTKEIHIIGDKTDLYLDITGRLACNGCGYINIPDGEVFCAPVHQKTHGYIYYDLPFSKSNEEINGAYLEFEKGKVVKATAESGEQALLDGLATDEGASYLGELGLGINYGIDRVMKNTLFDEKIGGTVHVTLGAAYESERGGAPDNMRNKSAIHWDLVKDMRKPGSIIEADGKIVFKEGKWLV